MEEGDIDTLYVAAANTTVLTIDPAVGGGTITFFGESETDVLSAISFLPARATIASFRRVCVPHTKGAARRRPLQA